MTQSPNNALVYTVYIKCSIGPITVIRRYLNKKKRSKFTVISDHLRNKFIESSCSANRTHQLPSSANVFVWGYRNLLWLWPAQSTVGTTTTFGTVFLLPRTAFLYAFCSNFAQESFTGSVDRTTCLTKRLPSNVKVCKGSTYLENMIV